MLEGWTIHLIYGAIGAIVLAALLIVAYFKKGQYDEEARRGILAEIWLPSGRPIKRVAQPTPDGWVRLGKLGDYKLAVPRRVCECGHDESDHKSGSSETKGVRCVFCDCTKFKEANAIPAIRRWASYPSKPFLGLGAIQTNIRTEAWFLNNPEPITPSENRTKVTAVDAQVHTREIEGESAAIQIQLIEAQQKQLVAAIANQPNKTLVYVMLGAAIILGLVGVVPNLPIG